MEEIANKHLGWPGKMISGSKSGYCERHPNNIPVFNSNIVMEKDGIREKVWFGDIDVTLSHESLSNLANELEGNIYVLREMDGRFDNEKNPRIERFVFKVTKDGEKTLGDLYKSYNPETFTRDGN